MTLGVTVCGEYIRVPIRPLVEVASLNNAAVPKSAGRERDVSITEMGVVVPILASKSSVRRIFAAFKSLQMEEGKE